LIEANTFSKTAAVEDDVGVVVIKVLALLLFLYISFSSSFPSIQKGKITTGETDRVLCAVLLGLESGAFFFVIVFWSRSLLMLLSLQVLQQTLQLWHTIIGQ